MSTKLSSMCPILFQLMSWCVLFILAWVSFATGALWETLFPDFLSRPEAQILTSPLVADLEWTSGEAPSPLGAEYLAWPLFSNWPSMWSLFPLLVAVDITSIASMTAAGTIIRLELASALLWLITISGIGSTCRILSVRVLVGSLLTISELVKFFPSLRSTNTQQRIKLPNRAKTKR